MTAQGGARPTNRVYGAPRARQGGPGATGNKRLTSQEPAALPGVRVKPGQGRNLAASSGRPSNNPAMPQPRGGPLYASQNQGLAGINVQGRGARLPANPGMRPALSQQNSEAMTVGQQPVSFNINFNTTNISLNK